MLRQKQFQIGLSEKLAHHHTPIKLSPSFRIKFLSPYRLQIFKTQIQKESKEEYFTAETPTLLRPTTTKSTQRPFKRYQTPDYKYFKRQDSDSDTESLQQLMNIVKSRTDKRVTR